MSGIYVHVPWCRAICPYCAFAVVRDVGKTPWAAYVDAVLRERETRAHLLPTTPETVFLGGGTPSRMPTAELSRLIAGLDPGAGAEISAEVNPEDAGAGWLHGALDAGLTRISVGVQTFDGPQSRLLGRGHSSPQALEVLERIRALPFQSWSADLMFALPGQTLADLERDLDVLLALDPPHISVYGLTFEEGTPFEARRRAGKLVPPPDDLWREMYDTLVDTLEEHELFRYEVSNFARPGHRSRHNQGYWAGRPYLGLGPGAHGFGADGSRWVNHADPTTWMGATDPSAHTEQPTAEQSAVDRLVSGMRHIDGVNLDDLAHRSGHRPSQAAIARLVNGGSLVVDGPNIALSYEGFPIADGVIAVLVAALQPVTG